MRRLPLGTIDPKLHLKRDLQKLTWAWVRWLVLGFMTTPLVVPLTLVWLAGLHVGTEYTEYTNYRVDKVRPQSVRRRA